MAESDHFHLWLIRHGETQANIHDLVCGQLDCELTERGEDQIRQLGKILPQYFDSKAARIFSSSLKRALRSAELLFPESQIIPNSALSEMNTGELSEITMSRLKDTHPNLRAHHLNPELIYPGGESLRSFHSRVAAWLEELRADPLTLPGSNQVVVCHGGTINHILFALLGISLEKYPGFALRNASLTHVMVNDSQQTLPRVNFVNLCPL